MSGSIQQTNIPSSNQQGVSSSYASIQIRDAVIKFSLYIQKLLTLQQLPNNEELKCYKLVRLSFETFLKYSQSEQFTKQSFQMCKSAVLTKNSYYSLYLIDLMIKNSKYLIRQGKKQVESLFKQVWQRVYGQKGNEEKLENLKVMVRCWGCLFGDKVEEHIRKWLESKYGVKKIQLNEQNEKAFKEVYGDKKGDSGKLSNTSSNNNISQCGQSSKIIRQTLINSLVQENGNTLSKRDSANILQKSISRASQLMIAEHSGGEGSMMMKTQSSSSAKASNAKQTVSVIKKPTTSNKLQGVNRSLLQALDLQ